MKNAEISRETKKALAASLKKAMQQKPFDKITVKEIITDCGVNRNTFYYHFNDIYALLRWMFTEEAIEVVKQFDLLVDYEDAIRFVMDYVDKNDHIISCAFHSIGRDEMNRFFYSDFIAITSAFIEQADEKAARHLEPDFKKFLAEFYTEALAGMLVNWASERHTRDREKTIKYLTNIISDGLVLFSPSAE